MNVALDATPLTLTSGGLRRYVEELSTALAREHPEDTYHLLSDQPFQMPAAAPSNLIRGPQPESGRRWWLNGLPRALRQSATQVFHGTNFEVPLLGRTPAILTIHDLSPWRNPEWHHAADRVRRRTPWLIRLRRARIVLTVSEAARREVVAHFHLDPARVRAIPLAAAPLFQPRAPSDRPPAPYFLFVGTLEPRKNLPALLEAWRATRAQTGADLLIAGRPRADFVPIPPADGLKFLGEVPDAELPQLYSDALAFVYPTFYEGFGLPVLEAMQCGCPVITSKDPAVTEISAGAAIHAATPVELADALRALAADPHLRARMHAAGLQRAAAFSWSRTARATRALYAEIAGGAA